MQNAGKFLAVPAGQVDGNFRPEMRVAPVKHQKVARAQAGLHVQRQLKRVDLFTCRLGFLRLGLKIGKRLRSAMSGNTYHVKPKGGMCECRLKKFSLDELS